MQILQTPPLQLIALSPGGAVLGFRSLVSLSTLHHTKGPADGQGQGREQGRTPDCIDLE